MLWLGIAGLIIAGVSAVFGIWTAKDLVVRNAIVATGLTGLGLAVGTVSALLQRRASHRSTREVAMRHDQIVSQLRQQYEHASKREKEIRQQFRALQGVSVLNRLEVRWFFPDAPESLLAAVALADAMEHSLRLSDDEFDRMPSDGIQSIVRSWHIDHAVVPILAALGEGSMDARSLYKGDVAKADAAFRDGCPGVTNPDEAWFHVSYCGPMDPILLLPLNRTHDGVIALGRKTDDVREVERREDRYSYEQFWNDVADSQSFGFKAVANRRNSGLELVFEYDAESLNAAAKLAPKQIRSCAWPDEFNLILIADGFLKDAQYLDKLGAEFSASGSNAKGESTLTIVANGMAELADEFRVDRAGTFDFTVHRGAYDDPEKEFAFTKFRVSRITR